MRLLVGGPPALALGAILALGLSAALGCRPAPGACSVPAGDDLSRFEPICQLLDDSTLAVRQGAVVLGDASGRKMTWSRGGIDAETPLELASASKWLAAATLLRLVEQGTLSLDDRPQDYLGWATSDDDDPRSRMTLRHMLAFTTGLEVDALARSCAGDADTTLEACARTFYDENHEREPGESFYYGPPHLHVAGAMAEAASGRSFSQLFTDEVARPLAMADTAGFLNPSATNPRVGGDAVASAADYERFLLALLRGDMLNGSRTEMHDDHTPAGEVEIVKSPLEPYDLEWHYAYGNWRECPAASWSDACSAQRVTSSPGAFGFTPWIDWDTETWGIVAVKRSILASPAGDSVFLAFEIRPLLEAALDR